MSAASAEVLTVPSDELAVKERFVALTIPVVTDWPYPNALPIATTCSPTLSESESPMAATAFLTLYLLRWNSAV